VKFCDETRVNQPPKNPATYQQLIAPNVIDAGYEIAPHAQAIPMAEVSCWAMADFNIFRARNPCGSQAFGFCTHRLKYLVIGILVELE